MLQVFLNVVAFGFPLQKAVEQSRVWSMNFPNSIAPHAYAPGRLCIEEGIAADVSEELLALGHKGEAWARYPAAGGAVCCVMKDPRTGLLHAGADPRRECYAIAW
jgi:gamma-glutamyltranspeptidase/glutathione hydrolase